MNKPKIHHQVGKAIKRSNEKTRSLTVNPPTIEVGADDLLGREAEAQIPQGLDDIRGWSDIGDVPD
jgi:hypothetical protein